MTQTSKELSDVTIHNRHARIHGVRAAQVELRPWIADFPVCQALNQYQILHVGIHETTAPMRVVRTKQTTTYFLACYGGKGLVLIDGRWRVCRNGFACLLPPHTLNAFQAIPRALEEAALIDGCNWGQMFWHVLLPAASPGLVAAAMFSFMTAWNDYLFAVILTSTIASKTMPVVVAGFATDVTTERTLMAASGVLAVIPPLLLAFLFQRLIVQGLTSGAVKD